MDNAATSRPPAPACSLRIGIVGHRSNKLQPGALDQLERTLRRTLGDFEQALGRAAARHAWAYDTAGTPRLRVISSLAEGTDILGARAALTLDRTRLNVVLPFARDEFARDLSGGDAGQPDWAAEYRRLLEAATAVLELETPADPDDAEQRNAAYDAAGRLTVGSCDVLVAVWDGEEPAGRGGTAEMIDHALALGMTVARIAPDGDDAELLSRSNGPSAGADAGAPMREASARASTPEALDELVDALLAPPGEQDEGGGHDEIGAGERYRSFLAEHWHRRALMGFYRTFLALFAGHGRPRLVLRFARPDEPGQSDWDGYFRALGDGAAPDTEAPESSSGAATAGALAPLHERWVWADHLANVWSEYYRSAYVLNFLLAALAVLTGLVSVFWWDLYVVKAACVTGELALIVLILVLVRAGKRGDWHRRWIDYRRLAEELRGARSMALLGRSARGPGTDHGSGGARANWIAWYVRATLADMDLPSVRMTPDYLRRVVDAATEADVGRPAADGDSGAGQIRYHERNAAMLSHLDHRLHTIGERLFATTGLVVAAFVLCFVGEAIVIPWIEHGAPRFDHLKLFSALKPTVTFLAGGLPTVAAAISGIRAQGDFRSFAEQSRRTGAELRCMRERLLAVRERPTRTAVIRELEAVGEATMSDLRTWGLIYSNRELDLPA